MSYLALKMTRVGVEGLRKLAPEPLPMTAQARIDQDTHALYLRLPSGCIVAGPQVLAPGLTAEASPGPAGGHDAKGRAVLPAPAWLVELVARKPAGRGRQAVSVVERPERPSKPAAPAPAAKPAGSYLTETGNAERFSSRHGERIRYCTSWDAWLVWDGQRWCRDTVGEVQQLAKETVRSIYGEAERTEEQATRRRLAKHADKSESRKARDAMIALARSEKGIGITHAELDQHPWLLNVENGTIDLRTGKLRPHEPGNLLTKLAPVTYDAGAQAPTFLAFLDRIMAGKADLAGFVQRALGYALTGDVGEQVLFFLHGAGANGKSTLLRLFLDLLGDYGRQAAPELLQAKAGDQHPTAQADLFGARLAVCQETEGSKGFAESTVKQLTGGDRIKARRMREDFWEFEPSHKLFIAGNHRPAIRGTDEGIWRRIRLVPFTVTIPEGERDPALLDKLKKESAGILAWAVRGCLEWKKHGLGDAAAVRQATADYRSSEDVVGGFLEDCCIIEGGAKISRKRLRGAYEDWCEETGETPIHARAFAEKLRERGCGELSSMREGGGQPTRGWSGVRLRGPSDPEVSERSQVGSSSHGFPVYPHEHKDRSVIGERVATGDYVTTAAPKLEVARG